MRVADQTPLIQSLENSKETTISHDYKDYSSNDNLIYCYKNYMTLNCKISTTYKVNPTEESKILANIKNALCVAFNSRKVDFGEEIPYDSILSVIQNADDRIQNVILDEPELKAYAVDKDGNDYDILKANGSGVRPYYIDMVAKNVVNGKLPYYEFDNSFKYNFGQNIKKFKVNGSEVNNFQLTNLSSVKTETEIELSTVDKELKSNDKIEDVIYSRDGKKQEGRLVSVILEVKNVSKAEAIELGNKVLEYFDDEEKAFYDIQVYLDNVDEKNQEFPVIGYKHKTSNGLVWD